MRLSINVSDFDEIGKVFSGKFLSIIKSTFDWNHLKLST